jgi:hypothetical protein
MLPKFVVFDVSILGTSTKDEQFEKSKLPFVIDE